MKKILFHSLTIPPDNVSTGMLVAEIANGFKELGVDVEILASSCLLYTSDAADDL